MRALRAALLCALAGLGWPAAGTASAEERHTFALVAAMGDRFSAVNEVPRVGSNLPAYRRRSLDVKDDGLNKVALKALGDAVASLDPQAERIYLIVRLPGGVQDRPSRLEESSFETVLRRLREMPQRRHWHRIVVVTPAWRTQASDGLAPGVGGIGLFTQPLCQGDLRFCDTQSRPPTAGVEAATPSGEKEAASRYLAPFFFAKVRILDPASLEVLDTQDVFDHEKLFDPDSGAMDMSGSVERKALAARIVGRIEASALEAVRRSELRGRVEVQDRGEVRTPR